MVFSCWDQLTRKKTFLRLATRSALYTMSFPIHLATCTVMNSWCTTLSMGEPSQISWTFVAVSPSNVQNISHQTHSKKGTNIQVEIENFYCCKGSTTWQLPISQSHWSLLLLGNEPKKFDLVHQTVSHQEAHTDLGTRLHLCTFTFWTCILLYTMIVPHDMTVPYAMIFQA